MTPMLVKPMKYPRLIKVPLLKVTSIFKIVLASNLRKISGSFLLYIGPLKCTKILLEAGSLLVQKHLVWNRLEKTLPKYLKLFSDTKRRSSFWLKKFLVYWQKCRGDWNAWQGKFEKECSDYFHFWFYHIIHQNSPHQMLSLNWLTLFSVEPSGQEWLSEIKWPIGEGNK